ncbi:hypothetical protein CGCA056_v002222 [Colletotrichum aenigma]|uniref:uncharacterized protein n=1 Tax=Colletotrichum aenigma TaxID=1215731 RepID=UPI001872EDE3|nr:uncharacterized protein CGCA056_v002222 [Colletotrichum aenigma]KAF5525270.1 hypothetical protein CGCA056_v002222 [Colletotrichum aenigma]
MQFSVAVSAILSAMAVQTALAATVCVIGFPNWYTISSQIDSATSAGRKRTGWGKDNESCQKQNPNNEIWCLNDKANYCSRVMKQGTNTPVSATCDADCCDTVTGWGTGCPK